MNYSAADIVGKTLYAATRVPIKKLPTDSSAIIRYAVPGEPIGEVYSFLEPKTGRSVLHWSFVDPRTNVLYYTEHRTGYYDLNQLRSQGLQTIEEKQLAQLPFVQQIGKRALQGLFLYGAVRIGLEAYKTFRNG